MHLSRLDIRNLRVVREARLELSTGICILVGANGSGKSSVLEAIHVLGTGRSFRTRRATDLVTRGAPSTVVHGSLVSEPGGRTEVGVELGQGINNVRIGGERARSASQLARLMPIALVTADSQRLLTDGAELRRRLLDWSLFHVEPEYTDVHGTFRRALRQRTAALRSSYSAASLKAWNDAMAVAGEELDRLRSALLAEVLPTIGESMSRMSGQPVRVSYEKGWPEGRRLAEVLDAATPRDLQRGFGDAGPQRADLSFTVMGRPARHVLSRGEAKLAVVSVVLAQAAHLVRTRDVRPVILVDDLAAELDAASRSRFMAALTESGSQAVVTTVAAELVSWTRGSSHRLFHVERGAIEQMV